MVWQRMRDMKLEKMFLFGNSVYVENSGCATVTRYSLHIEVSISPRGVCPWPYIHGTGSMWRAILCH